MKRTWLTLFFAVATLCSAQTPASKPAPPAGGEDAEAMTRRVMEQIARGRSSAVREKAWGATTKAAKFLISAQEEDGGWDSKTGPGITCLVLKALVTDQQTGANHPAVKRGLEFLKKFQHKDGGIYGPEGLIKNYETSVALSLYAALKDPAYKDTIENAQKFLKELQWDEGESKTPKDANYGGAGYGRSERPDLSNTQMMLDALKDSGLPPDDPAYKKALIFISRCQMLGESNDQDFAKSSKQGGFIYTPVNGGESKAGKYETGGRTELRSYGSMTYAGFKSMLYCGLTKDDARVKAAMDWIQRYWTLDYNPNMPEKQSHEGLYYFYHTFSRALLASGETLIEDKSGRQHDWRSEIIEKLVELQKEDGSWTNDADRFMEGNAALTTAYAVLALQAAFPANP